MVEDTIRNSRIDSHFREIFDRLAEGRTEFRRPLLTKQSFRLVLIVDALLEDTC